MSPNVWTSFIEESLKPESTFSWLIIFFWSDIAKFKNGFGEYINSLLIRENYDIIGELPKFYTGTGDGVTPFLAIMKKNSEWKSLIRPNLNEVDKIFYPKSYNLLSPKFHLREKPPLDSSMLMTWKINYNDENIWGLTARVLVTISAGLGLREFPPCDDI